jgi:hypothetical protein
MTVSAIVRKRNDKEGGIYNAQAKDLCTTQTCAFCGPKSNLDRSYIIILMPTVEICLD